LSNDATFLYQLWVREFGTNNLPDCSNMCHEASGRVLTAVAPYDRAARVRRQSECAILADLAQSSLPASSTRWQ
jgi:predicted molibdopterin-dependent oxidoreductase YjgC